MVIVYNLMAQKRHFMVSLIGQAFTAGFEHFTEYIL